MFSQASSTRRKNTWTSFASTPARSTVRRSEARFSAFPKKQRASWNNTWRPD